MLKEFFLVDYNSINSFKEISAPLLDIATQSFLLIAAIFELFRGFIGKSNVESRVTIFILAAISITAFNQYNQKVLDVSFETSDKILSKLHITSMTKISDVMKSTPGEEAAKNSQSVRSGAKPKPVETSGVLGEARMFMANNLAIALAWLVSVIAIGLSRILFTVIYYALIVLAPLIIFISVFPGFEGSLKTFWQTFIWCFLAPIVFSVIFVLMHLIAQKEQTGTGLEQLINVLLYGIFLVGSFVMTYKISSSQPISGFAEHASMIGAIAMSSPFTSASSFAQSAIHSPLATLGKSKAKLNGFKSGADKALKGHLPFSGVGDATTMSSDEVRKKFGSKKVNKLHAEQSKQATSSQSSSQPSLASTANTNVKSTSKAAKGSQFASPNKSAPNPTSTIQSATGSTQSFKEKYLLRGNNIVPRNSQGESSPIYKSLNTNTQTRFTSTKATPLSPPRQRPPFIRSDNPKNERVDNQIHN